MTQVHDRKLNTILRTALLLSLFVHLSGLFYKIAIEESKISRVEDEQRIPIFLNSDEAPRTKLAKSMQIVDNVKNLEKKKPVESRFLSHSDQSVDRQTVSKAIGSFKEAGLGVKNGSEAEAKQQKKKKTVSFSDLSLNSKDFKAPDRTLSQLGLSHGVKGVKGLGKSNDYVDDIPLADLTQLNTIEYKYYGFYHRIKQKLEQHWGRSLRKKAENLYKSGRRIASNEDKITSLEIIIDSAGNITNIAVKSTSGVKELDDAAIESFNKAGPFPNPPKGMLKGGMAKIEWGFVVKS
ncbi:MAG: hypothetical protein COW00_05315 [Bdellovibrio sp. CG12_big_fil_rev_8_21_14_0_65_39_13]|nr:MAG: hypothetical protein COW78_17850 [Bdellovibrio sp. CG22_combo_CG10-13_8_21_14_all_39_27]PIQ60652.1 MAG: hypothetical protein COW00_05315 [Bdellovibrio sp. CG12_big_fil_rev_8_21_14_0_65_39_13]PIR37036.1 MAG: hypothetical protein COV37_00675 [Bdellovibrio sp. CG11_big_fil_rev_8_21_14_0_20_39_38]PJB52439.1 MAG: hypothetical protein CO099_12690 [Bdellovibrio sp. CG_4_9_14_3_um_filter_39_7]